jgi:hypothetical protein
LRTQLSRPSARATRNRSKASRHSRRGAVFAITVPVKCPSPAVVSKLVSIIRPDSAAEHHRRKLLPHVGRLDGRFASRVLEKGKATLVSNAKGFVVKVTAIRIGDRDNVEEIFDVTYLPEEAAIAAVMRHCGTGPDSVIEILEPLMATDLGPGQVRSRLASRP